MVNRAVAKSFRSASYYTEAEQAVQKCVSECQIVYAVKTRMMDSHVIPVSVEKFNKQEVEKNFFEKAKMD